MYNMYYICTGTYEHNCVIDIYMQCAIYDKTFEGKTFGVIRKIYIFTVHWWISGIKDLTVIPVKL